MTALTASQLMSVVIWQQAFCMIRIFLSLIHFISQNISYFQTDFVLIKMVLYLPNFSLVFLIHVFLYAGVYCMRRFDPDTVPERPNLFFYKRGGSIHILG